MAKMTDIKVQVDVAHTVYGVEAYLFWILTFTAAALGVAFGRWVVG